MIVGGVIVGIGTDVCPFERMKQSYERHGEAFAHRLLGVDEQDLWTQRKAQAEAGQAVPTRRKQRYSVTVRHLAKRFAAKEAIGKALGMGVAWPATLHNVQILNDEHGRPYLLPGVDLAPYLAQRGWRVHLSLSDTDELAMAFAIVECLHQPTDSQA